MAYTKTNWQDLPNTTTPITASRLNNMEDGIKTNDDKLLGNIAAGTLIADITGNAATATSLENRSFITANSSTYLQGNDGDIPTKKGLENWNGAYNSSNDSNLEYCKEGKFQNIINKKIDMGTISLTNNWNTFYFNETFTNPPIVVLTPNTSTGGVIAGKVMSITTTEFQATIGGSISGNIDFNYIAIGE